MSSSVKWRLSSPTWPPRQLWWRGHASCLWAGSLELRYAHSTRPRSGASSLLHFSDSRAKTHHPQNPTPQPPTARDSCPNPSPLSVSSLVGAEEYSASRKYRYPDPETSGLAGLNLAWPSAFSKSSTLESHAQLGLELSPRPHFLARPSSLALPGYPDSLLGL